MRLLVFASTPHYVQQECEFFKANASSQSSSSPFHVRHTVSASIWDSAPSALMSRTERGMYSVWYVLFGVLRRANANANACGHFHSDEMFGQSPRRIKTYIAGLHIYIYTRVFLHVGLYACVPLSFSRLSRPYFHTYLYIYLCVFT